MMKNWVLPVVAVVSLSLVVAGCSKGGGRSTAPEGAGNAGMDNPAAMVPPDPTKPASK
jgi:hypothetical protein